MTSFGAKIYTAIIKNPVKKRLVYRMLMDGAFVNKIVRQGDKVEKMLYYVHNYLTKPKLVIVWLPKAGLGNQMYMYAFGRALQHKGYDVVFDAHWWFQKANAQAENVVSNGGGGGGR